MEPAQAPTPAPAKDPQGGMKKRKQFHLEHADAPVKYRKESEKISIEGIVDKNGQPKPVPIAKLLSYVKKDELVHMLGESYVQMMSDIATRTGKQKVDIRDLKRQLSMYMPYNDILQNKVMKHELMRKAVERYRERREKMLKRLADPAYRKRVTDSRRATRHVMSQPARQMKGCLATRLKPADYEYCLQNFDQDIDYEKMKIVPANALKQSVFEKYPESRNVLQKYDPDKLQVGVLPAGIQRYIKQHPREFVSQMDLTAAQLEHMAAAVRAMGPDSIARFKAYMQEHKDQFDPLAFARTVGALGAGERNVGGCCSSYAAGNESNADSESDSDDESEEDGSDDEIILEDSAEIFPDRTY